MKWAEVIEQARKEHPWGDHLCNYSALKRALGVIKFNRRNNLGPQAGCQEFWQEVDEYLDAVELFITQKTQELLQRAQGATSQTISPEQPATETTLLIGNRYAPYALADLRNLNRDLHHMRRFQHLNYEAFRKIVKKYDKTTESQTLADFKKGLDERKCFHPSFLSPIEDAIKLAVEKASDSYVTATSTDSFTEAPPTFFDLDKDRVRTVASTISDLLYRRKGVAVCVVVGVVLLLFMTLVARPNFLPKTPEKNWQAHMVLMGTYCSLFLIIYDRPAEVVMAGFGMILLALNVITYDQMFSGFSNVGVLANGILLVVAKGLSNTGGVERIVLKAIGSSRRVWVTQLRVLLFTAGLSTVLNNTPIGAMMVPIMESFCSRQGLSVSHFLMPISFAIMLGGTCTIVGSSANLVTIGVAQQLSQQDGGKVPVTVPGFFSPALVGIPTALAGVIYMLVFSPLLLAIRRPYTKYGTGAGSSAPTFMSRNVFRVPFTVEKPLIGKTVKRAALGMLPANLIHLHSGPSPIPPAHWDDHILRGRDTLVFSGNIHDVMATLKVRGLNFQSRHMQKIKGEMYKRRLAEAVISNESSLIGKSIADVEFRRSYNAAVIGIATPLNPLANGNGEGGQSSHPPTPDGPTYSAASATAIVTVFGKDCLPEEHHYIQHQTLGPGTVLLIATNLKDVQQRLQASGDFAMVAVVDSALPGQQTMLEQFRMWLSLFGLFAIIAATATRLLNVVTVSFLVALVFIIAGVVRVEEAWKSIKGPMLLLIACSFAISEAIRGTGLATWLAGLVMYISSGSLIACMVIIFALTWLIGMFINNAVTAVLVYPIAYESVSEMGVSATPMVYLIIIAASASFFTPISYQTNQMVWEPGAYRFADFMKFGGPLQLVVAATCIPLIYFYYGVGIIV
eukprot:TRINITY_DN74897_c0_g1_i1.p1 TRINITY_DN74897_c0_g1~~TRINITY_DN74897_c0_g1_i1.p1  ORF type:complete len:906 (+),score=48.64 TRINITY_DN74897_c0_g1_i1:23-2740(+)